MTFLIFLGAVLGAGGKGFRYHMIFGWEKKKKKTFSFRPPHLQESMKVANLEIDFHIITLMRYDTEVEPKKKKILRWVLIYAIVILTRKGADI